MKFKLTEDESPHRKKKKTNTSPHFAKLNLQNKQKICEMPLNLPRAQKNNIAKRKKTREKTREKKENGETTFDKLRPLIRGGKFQMASGAAVHKVS